MKRWTSQTSQPDQPRRRRVCSIKQYRGKRRVDEMGRRRVVDTHGTYQKKVKYLLIRPRSSSGKRR
eukprot:6199334-Pleurochrysis_carterae.AAC.5